MEYDSVHKIYLVYSKKYNRYQLFLNSHQKPEEEKEEEENDGILIYDRFTAIKNRTSTSKIFEIIDSNDGSVQPAERHFFRQRPVAVIYLKLDLRCIDYTGCGAGISDLLWP